LPLRYVLEPADDQRGGHVERQVADDVDGRGPRVPRLRPQLLGEHGAHVEAQHVAQVDVHPVATRFGQHLRKIHLNIQLLTTMLFVVPLDQKLGVTTCEKVDQ
jgi:hypothetical protein